jgi:hyperosmotically inducible periplasmic protein
MRRRVLSFVLGVALLGGAPSLLRAETDRCPDALITAAVKARLMADDVTGALKINVETEACVVTLKGCVESASQSKRARNLAKKSKGVKAVVNHLTLCSEEETE